MTAQIADAITIDGVQQMLFTEPLSAWFASAPKPSFVPDSTANWRGYVASWEIRDGRLFLTSLKGEICDDPAFTGWACQKRRPASLADLFAKAKPPIFAEWYSGTLRVPLGAQIKYQHMGYESVFEFDLLLTIEKGRVVTTTTIDNRGRGNRK